jgi:ribosomal-protein-alanine N-acetyltransferase
MAQHRAVIRMGKSMAATIVETEHLFLRPWVAADRPELERLFGDPAVRGNRSLGPERVVRLADASLRQWQVNGFGPWAAIDKASGSWVGRIGFDELTEWPGPDKVEVGFELHRVWWGRGLATEGALAALRFAFEGTASSASSASPPPPTPPPGG